MDSIIPTVGVLYNYDTDRDASPGLLIARGGNGPDEDDPAEYQAWRTPGLGETGLIQGNVTVYLWTAMKNFDDTKGGAVTVYLRDCDGSDCVEVGSDTLAETSWQDGNPSWVLKTFEFSVSSHTVASGHTLELKVIVEGSSDDDMWFAYDTKDHRSRLII